MRHSTSKMLYTAPSLRRYPIPMLSALLSQASLVLAVVHAQNPVIVEIALLDPPAAQSDCETSR
jgi:hypothetical protein